MTDSFFVIPSKSDQSIATLKKENTILRAQLEEERKRRIEAENNLKKRQEHDQHLRDSIMLARKEVSPSDVFVFSNTHNECHRRRIAQWPPLSSRDLHRRFHLPRRHQLLLSHPLTSRRRKVRESNTTGVFTNVK